MTKTELRELLGAHDALVRDCVAGTISLDELLSRYNDLPFAYALDGHEADLGEMGGDEEFSVSPAERRLITQPVDLSVQSLSEQWEAKHLYLPEIQREYVRCLRAGDAGH